MLYSLLIKLAMLGLTLGVVLWIGWTVPQSRDRAADPALDADAPQEKPLQAIGPLATSAAAMNSLAAPPRTASRKIPVPITGRLDLNRATAQELEALPGIGPVLAERIVEYRRMRGTFRDIEQLRLVKGIGKKKFDRIRLLVGVAPASPKGSRKAA